MKDQRIVFAQSRQDHLEIYLREGDGTRVYLTTRRFNPTLWRYLKDGRTVRELRTFSPGRNRGEQRMEDALRRTIRVIDWLDSDDAA